MPRKLLVIDSDPTLASELEPAFALYGFMVDHAADAESGLVLIDEFEYSIIVLDVDLPRVSGVEVLHAMRTRANGTPVVVVSTHLPSDLRERLTAFPHVRLIVPKPLQPKAFASLVAGLAAQ